MSNTHKLNPSGWAFVNVVRAEVSGGNDSFDREQKLERHPLYPTRKEQSLKQKQKC